MSVVSGLMSEMRRGWPVLKGRRFGLVSNQSAVDHDGEVLWNRLLRDGLPPVRVFSPEHGLWGTEQDMIPVQGCADPLTGLPVFSLYGAGEASLDPARELLADLDAVVFDIQDIGSRYYTFQATLQRLMRACSGTSCAVVVLDRPNPLGRTVEGQPLPPGFQSFVGQAPLPQRHGLTVGELALLFKEVEALDVQLEVVPCQGWAGEAFWDCLWTWPWIPPSPNMPAPETALVYTGACLLEATNISEGRGTTTPFLLFGAPWVGAPGELVAEARHAEGLLLSPAWFRPTFHKWAGELCAGVRLSVSAHEKVRSYRFFLGLLARIARTSPGFSWRTEAYEFVSGVPAIDLLCGGPGFRESVEAGRAPDALIESLELAEAAFADWRERFLIYRKERAR